MKLDLAHSSIRRRPPNRCRNSLLVCPLLLLGAEGQMPLSQGEHRRCRAFASLFQLSCVVLQLKPGQGKSAMGNAKHSGESVHHDHDGRQRRMDGQQGKIGCLEIK